MLTTCIAGMSFPTQNLRLLLRTRDAACFPFGIQASSQNSSMEVLLAPKFYGRALRPVKDPGLVAPFRLPACPSGTDCSALKPHLSPLLAGITLHRSSPTMILYVALFCAVVVLWRRLRISRFSLDKVPGPPRASFLLGMFFNPMSRTDADHGT